MPASMIEFVRNPGRGAHAAVMTGFAASTAPFVVVYPADDDFNAAHPRRDGRAGARGLRHRLRQPLHAGRQDGRLPLAQGADGARRQFHALSRRAAADARSPATASGCFTRRVIEDIAVESERGFCYSIELLVKCHRLGWRIGEVPARWFERNHGASRFQAVKWLPAYLRWYLLRLSRPLTCAARPAA